MDKDDLIFSLKHVVFNYDYEEAPVLNDINLDIHMGENICILGANGCGKSTLLKILSGLVSPQKGSFKAFGGEVFEKSFKNSSFSQNYHRRIGFIFQNSDAQLFCSTVKEELAFGMLQMGLAENEINKRINDVLNLFNISDLVDKTPFKLSGGQKKMVAIASTLVLNPDILILDEPTNELSPRFQRWIAEMLADFSKCGKTIITATHDLGLVQEISNRVIVFNENNTIARDGETSLVLQDKQFLADVNVIDSYYHLHGEGKHTHFHLHNY